MLYSIWLIRNILQAKWVNFLNGFIGAKRQCVFPIPKFPNSIKKNYLFYRNEGEGIPFIIALQIEIKIRSS